MKKRFFSISIVVLISLFVIGLSTTAVFADGTETLGPPLIAIGQGSGIVTAGTGLFSPGTIDFDVPGDVVQALLYWECAYGIGFQNIGDDTILVDSAPVQGTLIGNVPQLQWYFSGLVSQTYRAEITDMVNPGINSIPISGLDCGNNRFGVPANSGAGILVIYDDGSVSNIDIRDGNDTAFCFFPGVFNDTVPQVFSFASRDFPRQGTLSLFVSSVEGELSGSERPSEVKVTSGGITATYSNVFNSEDGAEWDTFTIDVDVPAGAETVMVEVISPDEAVEVPICASLVSNTAAFALPIGDLEGCTPGYWKQEQHFGSWIGYVPDDIFSDVFGCGFNETLLTVLSNGGGGAYALGRHGVAALLNVVNPDVNYPGGEQAVKDLVCDALLSGDEDYIEEIKNGFEGLNEGDESDDYCPLGRAELDGFSAKRDKKKDK